MITMKTTLTITLAMIAALCANAQTTSENDSVNYSLNLQELVVKSNAPKTKMKNGTMITRIEGTALESAGSVQDMLVYVPGMARVGGQLQVIGRGTPIYYVNGRRVHDTDELLRLRSHDIREVEVISNPGAAYDASVSAVVRIKTKRMQGEGLGGSIDISDAQALKNGNNNLASSLSLNYRHNNIDVFGGVNINNDYLDNYRSNVEQNTYGTVFHSQRGTIDTNQKFSRLYFNAGLNWQISDNSSAGFKMERGVWLKNYFGVTMDEDILRNKETEDHFTSVSDINSKNPNTFLTNIYYNGKMGKWGIDANIDYYTQRETKDDHISESSLSGPHDVDSRTETSNHLVAARLVADHALWSGNLKLGGEMTYVNRDNDYAISGIDNISSRLSEVEEQNYALFAEYGLPVKKAGMLTMGLRYEHVAFDFRDLTDASRSVRRNNDDFFPSLSFATRLGLLQMQLSYGVKTTRPSYYHLRSDVDYVSRYTLQTGEPTLKNEISHDLGLMGRWRFISFAANYVHIKDAIYDWTTPYDDNGVVMIGMVNFNQPIDRLGILVNMAHTTGCWSPSNNLGMMKQWLSFNLDDPREATGKREVTYNKPMFIFNSANSFSLSHNWKLELNSEFYGKSHFRNVRILEHYWNLTAAVEKKWKCRSLFGGNGGQLSIRLSCADIFNTARHDVLLDLGNYSLFQSDIVGENRSHYSMHRVALNIRYTFNTVKSKYKGQGAGSEAKKRM